MVNKITLVKEERRGIELQQPHSRRRKKKETRSPRKNANNARRSCYASCEKANTNDKSIIQEEDCNPTSMVARLEDDDDNKRLVTNNKRRRIHK